MRAPVLAAALGLLACHRHPPQPPPAPPAPVPTASVALPTQTAGMTVSGKVLERIDTGPYSYLRLDAGGGQQWVAVPKCDAKNGDEVVVVHGMPMDGFESKTLKRKFAHIVFGMLESGPAGVAPSGHPAAGQPVGQGPPTPAPAPIAVSRAAGPNGVSVAELFARKAAWKDKTVRVHGQVVKVLPGILGKNWIHVRDGSGSDDQKDNDLTVTSDDSAQLGEVVLVEGTVHTDKDLGSGYHFPVIIENAKISRGP